MSKYEVGEIVTCLVTGVEKYGVFVSLDNYYSGLIHISEVSTKFIKTPYGMFKIGDVIKAKIIEIDEKSHQVKLSLKNVNYRNKKHPKNKIVEIGTGFGILEDNLEKWIEQAKKDDQN